MKKRYFIIGDIHGQISMLNALFENLAPTPQDKLIFLGDYIDRGEDSKAVLERLIALEKSHACVFLKGNHEDMCLRGIDGDSGMFRCWLDNGGRKTLADCGGYIPAHFIAWMRQLRLSYETTDHYFVHAGLRPGVGPESASEQDKLWGREPFLSSDYDWGKIVVHGHTIDLNGPIVRPNRIGLDTGSFIPGVGRLTCLVLPDMRFVTCGPTELEASA